MKNGKIILVLGGARSGKSSFASRLAGKMSAEVIYIAAAQALDKEMQSRISMHKKTRNRNWHTIEEPHSLQNIKQILKKNKGLILFECLTLFVSNLLCKGIKEKEILSGIKDFFMFLKKENRAAVFVSNEIGWSIVPDNKMARDFRDIQGRVNQLAADKANEVYLVVAGIPMRVK